MAWNGSDKKVEKVGGGGERKKNVLSTTTTTNYNYKALVAALVVILGGGLAAWWFVGRARTPSAPSPDTASSRRIADVAPAVTPKVAETNDPHKGMVKYRGKWYPKYNSKGGLIWLCGDKVLYHSPTIHTNRLSGASLRKERQYFDTPVDVELAVLANTPLGVNRIGPAKPYDKSFEKKFLESLKTPIIVSHDDPEDVKALKRTVIETKAELKARYDAGEDIVAIMNDTAKQMKDLALYKKDLMNLVNREAKEATTDQDKQAIYEAANKMLAERGVAPMKLPYLLGRKLEREQQSANADK